MAASSRDPSDNPDPFEFSADLFVERDELKALVEWTTTQTTAGRLKSITAPPGCGKTWLLAAFSAQLQTRDDLFLIKIPAPSSKAESPPPKSTSEIQVWLEAIIEQAKAHCAIVHDFDPSASLEFLIARFIDDLCNECSPNIRPVLIVDGFDELLPNERQVLEKHLLGEFWRRDCVRLIVAFRDESSLSEPNLRRSEDRLELVPFTTDDGKDQLEKLNQTQENPIADLDTLLGLIPPYRWNHPGINTYLYFAALKRHQNNHNPLLTADNLRDSWRTLIREKLPTPGSLDEVETHLQKIVQDCGETWTIEEFARLHNYAISKAFKSIEGLQALSLVSVNKTRYKVAPGIREIIQAELALKRGMEI